MVFCCSGRRRRRRQQPRQTKESVTVVAGEQASATIGRREEEEEKAAAAAAASGQRVAAAAQEKQTQTQRIFETHPEKNTSLETQESLERPKVNTTTNTIRTELALRPATEITTTTAPVNVSSTTTSSSTTALMIPTRRNTTTTTTTSSSMPSPPRRTNNTSDTLQQQQQQQQQQQLGSSLKEAWMEMATENPNLVEEHDIRRAIELSLLDCALVQRRQNSNPKKIKKFQSLQQPPPSTTICSDYNDNDNEDDNDYQVLKIPPTATLQEIKASYRKWAIATHPDKGGAKGEFEKIALAYRNLLAARSAVSSSNNSSLYYEKEEDGKDHDAHHHHHHKRIIKSTAHWDKELKEHKDLVSELFASHAADLQQNVQKQQTVRDILQLMHKEAGSSNMNEKQERIRNSCFYLSLAVSYLEGIGALMISFAGSSSSNNNNIDEEVFSDMSPHDINLMQQADAALISQTALQLKRTIEGAVLQVHPEWAQQGLVGEEVQAFSDFLVYTLESDTILTDWAVAIFDETSGFVDVYKGCEYGKSNDSNHGPNNNNNNNNNMTDWARRTNTLTLRFVPGHYQPLLPKDFSKRPTLEEILMTLDLEGVFYVVTDGAA